MKIGITYDLRSEYLNQGYNEIETAEFDRQDTIDSIIQALRVNGYEPDPIGSIYRLVERLQAGDRWDMVFNIAEGLHGSARESQIPALLDAYRIPYTFSDPFVLALCLDKFACKAYLREKGVSMPHFAICAPGEPIPQVQFPAFVKPVAEGTGKGVHSDSIVYDRSTLSSVIQGIHREFKQPTIIETYLPGREFTVAIIGNGAKAQVLGTMEVLVRDAAQKAVYGYHTKEYCEVEILYQPARDASAQAAEKLALAVYRQVGCRDVGRVDIRQDAAGNPSFIEINPIPGLHPHHSDLPMIATQEGWPYHKLIGEIMRSARDRHAAGGNHVAQA
jgi:D-alanine-D-alanine ligase